MKSKQLLNIINDVEDRYILQASPDNNKSNNRVQKPIWIKWGVIAACIALLAFSPVIIPHFLGRGSVVPIEQLSPPASSPSGMRKFMNYNNYRYAFLEEGSTYNLSTQQLSDVLGTLEHDIQENPEANSRKNLAASFAIGGTVYALTSYDSAFRLGVEFNGDYYICERVDTIDDTGIDVAEYFKSANFPQDIEQIIVNDHMGTTELNTLPKDKISLFIDTLSRAVPATLTDEDYSAVSNAQTSGKSYRLFFKLKDGTQYKIYILPTLSLAMIGDNRYTLPQEFAADFGFLFEGLTQQPLPMQ